MKTVAVFALICLLVSVSFGQFAPGDRVRVVLTTDCVNARSAPNLADSTKITCKPKGSEGVIIAGPIVGNGLPFFNLQYSDGLVAWSAAKYLELVPGGGTPPPPPPSGSLSVSKIQGGYATAWYTAKDESTAVITGYEGGTIGGTLYFPASKDTMLQLTLRGKGGETVYTAWTISGSPPVPTLDSTKIAIAAYNAGRDSVAAEIRRILSPILNP